jgi:hypothetical protein
MGTLGVLHALDLPEGAKRLAIRDIAVNPKRKGEYFLLTEDGQIYGYSSGQWEPLEISNIDDKHLSVAMDGAYLVVLTEKDIWSLLMEQSSWSKIALPDGLAPASIAMPQQGLGQYYVVTSDNRIFTGVAQKTSRLTELESWPRAGMLEFAENVTYLGGANGIYCQGHWNIFTKEWWSIISKNYPPCY